MFFSEQKHQTFPCRTEIPFPSKKESSIWEWVKVNCRKRRTENTKKWKNKGNWEALVEGGKRKFQVEWGQQTEQSLVKNWKMIDKESGEGELLFKKLGSAKKGITRSSENSSLTFSSQQNLQILLQQALCQVLRMESWIMHRPLPPETYILIWVVGNKEKKSVLCH